MKLDFIHCRKAKLGPQRIVVESSEEVSVNDPNSTADSSSSHCTGDSEITWNEVK